MTSRAVPVVVDLARELGVRCEEPVVLRDLTNVVVHLAPAAVVARVPVTLGRLRGAEWEREIVALASFLAEADAPIVRPSAELPPGPHERDGLVISFWEHVAHDPERADAVAVGHSLRDLHAKLEGYPGRLPRFERLDEIEDVIDGLPPPEAEVLRDALARLAATPVAGPVRPIHGDVHFRNVLWSPAGPRWNDLENACLGPVEYDLAGLAWRGDDGTDDALAAYGPFSDNRLRELTPFLALFLAAWTLDLAKRHPEVRPFADERLDRIRAWLESASTD
jgi:Phosphotransferase enzyme family